MKKPRWRIFGKCLLACATLAAVNGCSTGTQVTSAVSNGADRAKELIGQKSDHALTQMNMARLHERQGSLRKALTLYEDLHARFPKDAEICNRIGVVYTKLEDHQKAQEYFLKALEFEPNNSEVLTDFGYALYLNNDLEAAEFSLQKALEEQPDNQRAALNLGLVLGERGRFNESLEMFRRCLPEAEAQANLAYIHVRRGEGLLAEQRYSQALTLDNKLTAASQALVQLADVRAGMQARLQMVAAQEQRNRQHLAAAPTSTLQPARRTLPAMATAPRYQPRPEAGYAPLNPPTATAANVYQPAGTPQARATNTVQPPVEQFQPPIRTVSATAPVSTDSEFRSIAAIHASHEESQADAPGRAAVTQAGYGYVGEEPDWDGDSPDVWR